jgi:hypothetical protein
VPASLTARLPPGDATSRETAPEYTYEAVGNRSEMVDPTGMMAYEYDALDDGTYRYVSVWA